MNKIKKMIYLLKNRSRAYELLRDDGIKFKLVNNRLYSNEKIYYYIEPNIEMSGFFAIFRMILSALYISDKMNFIPYVNIENSKYNVPNGFNGINNMWEYYFKNNKLDTNANIFTYNDSHSKLVYNNFFEQENYYKNGYIVNEEYLKELGNIVYKSVQFKDEIEQYLNECIKKIGIDKNTIGVHIRGSDYKLGFSDHPKMITTGQYFEKIDDLLNSKKYNKIFVATDDVRILKEFQNKYKSVIIKFNDVVRTENDKSVIFSENDRKNNGYYLGLEVIRDMYALSKCTALVAGLSQVATCARIYKYSYNNQYDDLCILDNGLYNGTKKQDKKLKKYEYKK